jgi:multidrug efflux pump subunit AcrB
MRVLVCCVPFLSPCLSQSVFVCVTVVLAVSAYVLSNKTFSRWIFQSENYKDQRFTKLGNTTLSLSTLSLSLLYLLLTALIFSFISLPSGRPSLPAPFLLNLCPY